MARAYIALGSNLGDRTAHFRAALRALTEAGATVFRASEFVETLPVGKTDQPQFLNAAAELQTDLSARDLLQLLLRIESSRGRVREERWGPRTLDLDLLLYDAQVIREPDLEVPHPRMHERSFVLQPLAEIAPEAWHPVLNKTVRELLDALAPAKKPGAAAATGKKNPGK